MRTDTCYLHPARIGDVCHMGIWYCNSCWLAYCKRCDDEEERTYLRKVWRAKELMCSECHSPDPSRSGVMTSAEEEQSGARGATRRLPAPASSAHSRGQQATAPGGSPASGARGSDTLSHPAAPTARPSSPASSPEGAGQLSLLLGDR